MSLFGKFKSNSTARAGRSSDARPRVFIACPYTVVPIMGYENVFDRINENFELEGEDSPQLVLARDEPSHAGLEAGIMALIRSCDIGIYDLSGDPPNLNVLYELGIARGLEKKCYAIRKDLSTENLPADLRGLKIETWRTRKDLQNKITGIITKEFGRAKAKDNQDAGTIGSAMTIEVLKHVANGKHTTAEIAQVVELPRGAVREILAELIESGQVRSEGARKGMRYFPASSK